MDRSGRALVLSGLLVGAVWLVTGGRSLWFDELFGLHAALGPWAELVRFVRDHDTHPPAYYVLLRGWTGVFGASERALRALSGVLALGTLAVLRGLAREHLGDRPAALAVVALVASPLFLQASAEATRYSLLTLLYAWAARETVRASGDDPRPRWRLAALGALLLYTHYLGAVLAGSLAAFALWEGRRLRGAAASLLVSGLAFAPWLPVLWYHLSAGRFDPPWRPALPPTLPLQLLHVVGFGGRVAGTASYFSLSAASPWIEALLALPVAVLLAAGFWSLWRRSPTLGRLAACCAGLPTLVLLAVSVARGTMVAYPRYFVFTLPFLALAVGSMAGAPLGRVGRAVAGLSGAVVVALAAGSLAWWGGNLTEGMGDRRALAGALRARVQARDALLVYPRWELTGVEYYLPELRGRAVALRSEWTQEALQALRGQVEHAAASDRVWVLQGFPISPGAFEAVYRRLARTHRVAYFGEFDGLRLTLFVRRVPR